MRSGVGTLVLDARRDGHARRRRDTPSRRSPTTEKMIRENPEACAAAIRAVKAAQQILKAIPAAPPRWGRSSFPRPRRALIAELIRRDAPFYDPEISPRAVESMNRFARELGLLSRTVGYEDVVWNG